MEKIANTQELQAELRRLIAYCSSTDRPSREKLASEMRGLADRLAGATPPGSGVDNSYGRGYFPLPREFAGLGRFVENLKPAKILDHKVFVEDNIHLLTVKVDTHLSIMGADMKVLLRLGLVRIQCNDPTTLTFYFQAKSEVEAEAEPQF